MTSAFVCASLGIVPTVRHADYLGSWLEVLREGSAPNGAAVLRPGVRLVREWGGTTHTVLVHDDSFEYRRQHHASLTQIAKLITGTHWSGPRFFGIALPTHHAGESRPPTSKRRNKSLAASEIAPHGSL